MYLLLHRKPSKIKDKWTFMTIKHIDLFMKRHARFSDAPGDRFGRLIVNGNSALGIHDEE